MKKKLMRFNLAALALVMVTSVLISGTFAKYTTAVSAQDTALIAKWDISSGEMSESTADLDLFQHAYDEAILDKVDGGEYILGPGVEDSFEVKLAGFADVDAIINLKIDKDENSAKAPIQYAVQTGDAFDWDSADIYYSEHLLAEAILMAMVDDDKIIKNDYLTGAEERVAADKETNTAGERTIVMKKTEEEDPVDKTIIVHWRWPFDVAKHASYAQDMQYAGVLTGDAWTDAMDTALGTASADGDARTEYKITLTLKADQVTPTVDPVTP